MRGVAFGGLLAAALVVAGVAMLPGQARAEEAAAATEALDPALKELLAKEKEIRKACKVEICGILDSKHGEGPDVDCHIVKTWPKSELSELIKKAQVDWPWGNTKCEAKIKIARKLLVSVVSEPKFVAELDEQTLACEIDRGPEKESYKFKVALAPKITFEAGKAVEAEARWGALEAPLVAKSVLWPATGLDNQVNAIGGELVKTVNEFVGPKCAALKAGTAE